MAAGLTALRGIANGWGYDITSVDVLDTYAAIMAAANAVGVDVDAVKADLGALIAASRNGAFSEMPVAAPDLEALCDIVNTEFDHPD